MNPPFWARRVKTPHFSAGNRAELRVQVISDELVKFSAQPGILTELRARLIKNSFLDHVSNAIGLRQYVINNRGDSPNIKRHAAGDSVEAVICAIYYDGGIESARRFVVDNIILPNMGVVIKALSELPRKRELLSEIWSKYKTLLRYEHSINKSGPNSKAVLTVSLYVSDRLISKGTGNTWHDAETNATEEAFRNLEPQD